MIMWGEQAEEQSEVWGYIASAAARRQLSHIRTYFLAVSGAAPSQEQMQGGSK